MRQTAGRPITGVPQPAGWEPYFSSNDCRFVLYQGDCLRLMTLFPAQSVDMIFADPPYFLSNNGITCSGGKMASVNKGEWDRSMGFEANSRFTRDWLGACQRLLKPDGSIWISGTSHVIHIVGYLLGDLGYKILNDITWVKPNPPPNLSCRYFTHATETVIWAGRDTRCRHKFNYSLMKHLNAGKQMTSVWVINAPRRKEKIFGKHPTQKPLALLERIIAASTDEADCILDPFCGSATTGIAAAKMGRAFAGLETQVPFLNIGIMRLVGVPQADSPERLLDLLAEHQARNRAASNLASIMGIVERQVHYYRQAGLMLGMLSPSSQGWVLTAAGEQLCEADRQTARRILAKRILDIPLVEWAVSKTRRLRSRRGRLATISRLLQECTIFSHSTCERRAHTIISWINWSDEVVPLMA